MIAARLLVALCIPGHLVAQAGVVRGTVTASDGTPLALARISVVGTKVAALTAPDGAFQIPGVAPGMRVIQVRMVGYATVLLPVDVRARDTVHVTVALVAAAVPLEAIVVKAEPAPFLPAMRGFEERRLRARGYFFNRQEIARMQPRAFTDVLRRVPGVQVLPVPGPYEPGEAVRMSRAVGITGGRPCPVLYYLNGSPFPVTGDVPINSFITPEDVAALEVYNGASQIPPEFNSSSHNARCGVVVIWTLSGVDTSQTR